MPEVLIETLGLSKIFHRDSTEIWDVRWRILH